MALRKRQPNPRPTNVKLATGTPVAAPAKKVVSAEKKHEKVWNLSDKEGGGRVMMIAGKNVRPGQAVRVPKDMATGSKRLKEAVAGGELHVGDMPPEEYLLAKNRIRAVVSKDNKRSHGDLAERKALRKARKAAAAAEAEAKDLVEETKKVAETLTEPQKAAIKKKADELNARVKELRDEEGRRLQAAVAATKKMFPYEPKAKPKKNGKPKTSKVKTEEKKTSAK